jgi:hypothetical protein
LVLSRLLERVMGGAAGLLTLSGLAARLVSPSPQFVVSGPGGVMSSVGDTHMLLEKGLYPALAAALATTCAGALATAFGAAWHSTTPSRIPLAVLSIGASLLFASSGRSPLVVPGLELLPTLLFFYNREMGLNLIRALGEGTVGGSFALVAAGWLALLSLAAGCWRHVTR